MRMIMMEAYLVIDHKRLRSIWYITISVTRLGDI